MNRETNWEPFTAGLRQLFIRAERVMQGAQASKMTPRHVLLALLDGDDKTAHILAKAINRTLLDTSSQGIDFNAPTSDFKGLLHASFAEAVRLGNNFVAAPHVALALLQPKSDFKATLRSEIDAQAVRAELEEATRDYPNLEDA